MSNKKLNRRKIRQIVIEETANAVGMVQEALQLDESVRGWMPPHRRRQPRTFDAGQPPSTTIPAKPPGRGIGKGLDHPFYTSGYNPAGKPVDYDYDAPDDDPMELGRYDGLNNNKDTTLYRDNPDYRAGFDEVSIDIDTKHSDVPPPPETGTPGDDENTPGYDGPINETNIQRLTRLKRGLTAKNQSEMYEGPIREAKKKKRKKKKDTSSKEQESTSGKYWYLGHLEKDYEPCTDWTKFGFAPVEEEEE